MTQLHLSNDCELLELYLLGGLPADEVAKFQEHLNTCKPCQEQYNQLTEVVGLLPLASDPVPTPRGMKNRILANVFFSPQQPNEALVAERVEPNEINNDYAAEDQRQEPRRTSRIRPSFLGFISVSLAAATIVALIYCIQLNRTIDDLRLQLSEGSDGPIQELKTNQAVKLNPATQEIVAQGLATIVIDKNGTHLLVQAEQLPKLEGTQAFQVWLIKGDVKVSAGTFLSNSGTGALFYTLKDKGYETIAITLEPDAFGDQPRGQIVLAAPIQI